jgi:DNA-directed RNA polymerase subunit RPC12/RpoP
MGRPYTHPQLEVGEVIGDWEYLGPGSSPKKALLKCLRCGKSYDRYKSNLLPHDAPKSRRCEPCRYRLFREAYKAVTEMGGA